MASPASKTTGSGFGGGGGDVELGDGGEQFVTAHIVHHPDGSQTVNKQIITAPVAGGGDDAVVIHETERHHPPSYYVNDQNVRAIPGAAATPPEPSVSGLAVASLVLGCVGTGFLLMALGSTYQIFFDFGICPLLAIIFGSVALCRIKKSRRQQQDGGEVVRQWRGQWQAITGIVLGSIVLILQIAFLVFVVRYMAA